MTDYTSEELEREIQDLWLRRAQLTQAEHARFYRLVHGHLLRHASPYYWTIRRCHAAGTLDELKDKLIADFYCDVIYLRTLKEDHVATSLAHLGVSRPVRLYTIFLNNAGHRSCQSCRA
ncbi:MAG: hypothetical protein IT487_11675 [Chromatiaceae bacterium]|nr:hypothetical protein [Chromatiaceae bacterium]